MSTHARPDSAALDAPSGLLPSDPPARAARWAGWLLIALALAAAIFAVSFRLPETVVAPFVIVPLEGAAPVQAPVAGQLASVRVQAGQRVRAGDELFQIRSDAVRDAGARLQQLAADQRALAERVDTLEAAHAAELAISDGAIALAQRELAFRSQHLEAASTLLARKEKAAADGLLPQISLLSDRLVMADSENARGLSEQTLQHLALQRQQRIAARVRLRNDELVEADTLRLRIATLEAELDDSNGDLRSIRAPFDAVVLSVAAGTPGDVLALGSELCQLARQDAAGQARLSLLEPDLARLQPGQTVRLFMAAYPYQRYGSVQSELGWISPAAVTGAQSPGFFAHAAIPPANPGMPLQIGMSGEARILVGRRTVLDLAMEPMRALRERAFIE